MSADDDCPMCAAMRDPEAILLAAVFHGHLDARETFFALAARANRFTSLDRSELARILAARDGREATRGEPAAANRAVRAHRPHLLQFVHQLSCVADEEMEALAAAPDPYGYIGLAPAPRRRRGRAWQRDLERAGDVPRAAS